MKDKKKALRIHHKERMRNRALAKFVHRGHMPRNAAVYGDTFTACSCYMCGNARHYYGLTLAEIKENSKLKDQLND